MFFRLQYAHFRPLLCVSIKFSRGHVYHLQRILQGARLFRPALLFCTLEYCPKVLSSIDYLWIIPTYLLSSGKTGHSNWGQPTLAPSASVPYWKNHPLSLSLWWFFALDLKVKDSLLLLTHLGKKLARQKTKEVLKLHNQAGLTKWNTM